MIRLANLADVPAIVDLGTTFWRDAYADQASIDRSIGKRFAESLLANPNGKILVAEEDGEVIGVLGFILFRHFWTEVPSAQELLWYVKPEHRPGGIAMHLMWEAERIAKELGVVDMTFAAPMSHAESAPIYARFGYKPLELHFQKRLN